MDKRILEKQRRYNVMQNNAAEKIQIPIKVSLWKRIVLWLRRLLPLLLLCVPVNSQAQSLKLPTAVFASAAGADWASTYITNTRYGMIEQNPMINRLQDRPTLMVAAGAALDMAGVAAWNHWIGKHHSRVAALGLYAAAAGRLYLTQRNMRTGLRQPRQPAASFWSGGTVGIK